MPPIRQIKYARQNFAWQMRGARCFFSWEKQVFLVGFSLTISKFLCKPEIRLNASLTLFKLEKKSANNNGPSIEPCSIRPFKQSHMTCRQIFFFNTGRKSYQILILLLSTFLLQSNKTSQNYNFQNYVYSQSQPARTRITQLKSFICDR